MKQEGQTQSYLFTQSQIENVKHKLEFQHSAELSKIKKGENIYLLCKKKKQCKFQVKFIYQYSTTFQNIYKFNTNYLQHNEECILSQSQIYLRNVKDQLNSRKNQIYQCMKSFYLENGYFKQPNEMLTELRENGFQELNNFYIEMRQNELREKQGYNYSDVKRKVKKKLDNVIGQIKKKLLSQFNEGIKVQEGSSSSRKKPRSYLNLTKQEKLTLVKEQLMLSQKRESKRGFVQTVNPFSQDQMQQQFVVQKKTYNKKIKKNNYLYYTPPKSNSQSPQLPPSKSKGKDLAVLAKMRDIHQSQLKLQQSALTPQNNNGFRLVNHRNNHKRNGNENIAQMQKTIKQQFNQQHFYDRQLKNQRSNYSNHLENQKKVIVLTPIQFAKKYRF